MNLKWHFITLFDSRETKTVLRGASVYCETGPILNRKLNIFNLIECALENSILLLAR